MFNKFVIHGMIHSINIDKLIVTDKGREYNRLINDYRYGLGHRK